MGSVLRVAAFAALIAFAGCSQAPAPPAAKLWTLFDVEALYAGGALPSKAIAANAGLPGGIPLGLILNGTTLKRRTALSDGETVEFLTTEVWANYPAVWIQPAYVPITGWSNGVAQVLGGSPWQPIFSVGASSGFYSPFWQIVYVEVPAGTAPGALTSERQILEGGYPLTASGGWTMPLVPGGVTSDAPGVSGPNPGWLDGEPVWFLNFGSSTFAWDPATNVVEEAPIYVLTFVGPDGSVLASPEIPTVLGAGPPGTGVAIPGSGQRDSAYWRVNTVVVPGTARVFVQPESQLSKDLPDGFATLTLTGFAAGASDLQINQYSGHVALNPSCFDDPSLLDHDDANPASCTWLDSEAALQANLDLSTEQPTAITLTWEITDLLEPDGTTEPAVHP